ncbi:site-specific DNA-methyltransferase [Elioraea tepidiphila]|jgi:adenine-specific DNA-methyltransferase|uniref:site-specific DNA-methyltransferase n=1 Tax=Elioraea tepidiphila TaxID=457934 RepID=UPI000477662D|nr:site-specific DNA-methyltransferase [Elioraea tepidiphila]
MNRSRNKTIEVEALTHKDAKRRNIPTAEFESLMREEDKSPVQFAYQRRNRDLDPQLVWRGKDEQDWSDLIVHAPPLYIQEKVHPKVLIDDLKRESKARAKEKAPPAPDLFGDFNGLHDLEAKTEFYQHDQNWSNRMILGDSLSVMASLAEREGLRGQVQCIYIDPPYGIKFNSNFQWSTTSRDVRDGKAEHVTREPEQVRAFRDTWRDGIHSYLTYLRDRLTVARDLLHESGSIFVQIGSDNSHLLKSLLDEVFGPENFIAQIVFAKTAGATSEFLPGTYDIILFYARDREKLKYRQPLTLKQIGGVGGSAYKKVRLPDLTERPITDDELKGMSPVPENAKVFRIDNLTSQSVGRDKGEGAASWFPVEYHGNTYRPSEKVRWKTNELGMSRLQKADRLSSTGKGLYYVRYFDDFLAFSEDDVWSDTGIAGFTSDKRYVVETSPKVVERCLLMSTDAGDLVLDPTCGSGTTAYVAEQWGRRWITIDTSRVALALARSRIMGARYPYYLLADSPEGQMKEAEVTRSAPRTAPTHGNIRLGFVYERVPHITLKSIANNAEIDVIWEKWQETLEPLRAAFNKALSNSWEEWEIPREAEDKWPAAAKDAHGKWWQARIARQKEIDASIAAKAEFEYLYDKPYTDSSRVRVAGPFTVESLSPHRVVAVDADDRLMEGVAEPGRRYRHNGSATPEDFADMILENLKAAGVQQAQKEDRITFTSLAGWPGRYICAEGKFMEGDRERRAGILIGPEFGTVSRPDLVAAAREAGDAGFDVLIACAFNYDAHSAEFDKLGRVPVLKARMNPDLHMGDDLKATASGNLFVVFGEPDIDIETLEGGMVRVRIKGIDVFKPQTGEIESGGPESIALWMIDTDYNEESFFVRHAYFLGANDPYKALKTTLKAEIDEEAWASLNSDTSRPFPKPASGRIAVKVINHLGDEVMKVFSV